MTDTCEITYAQQLVYKGLVCAYCKQPTDFIDSAVIYNGRSFGMVYACLPCRAWVGVHHGNTRDAYGRVANKELRLAKNDAHRAFDRIWREKHMGRGKAYKWLGKQLGIPKDYCHIGYFGVDTCKRVVEVCNKFLNNENT